MNHVWKKGKTYTRRLAHMHGFGRADFLPNNFLALGTWWLVCPVPRVSGMVGLGGLGSMPTLLYWIGGLVAFDDADQKIRAYEVKRGFGQFDAGKIRSIKRDLMCVQVLLRSYAEDLARLKLTGAESRIIFYYGVRSIPRPWSLVRDELDDHFGFPVVAYIEEANAYFQNKLYQLLETP